MPLTLLPKADASAKRRRKWVAAASLVAVVCIAVLVYPHTYGEKGDLELFVTVNPGPYAFDLRGQVVLTLTLENVGQTTVRVVPLSLRVDLELTDPNGTHVPSYFDLRGPPAYTVVDLQDLPAGQSQVLSYRLTDGGFLMNATGLYTVQAAYSMSDTFMEGGTPPYWKGLVASAPASFTIVP
jgi:hypothetical protein